MKKVEQNVYLDAFREIQQRAAEQCAPVIFGIKPSNLLIIDQRDAKMLKTLTVNTGLCARCFHHKTDKQVWFLFRDGSLSEILENEENRRFVCSFGYDEDMTMDEMLVILAGRFRAYRNHQGEFPHELGIFLGYPLGDVRGFIENKGQNCICSGYWKVYENEQAARETFRLYEMVKKTAIEIVRRGGLLENASTYQFAY